MTQAQAEKVRELLAGGWTAPPPEDRPMMGAPTLLLSPDGTECLVRADGRVERAAAEGGDGGEVVGA